MIATTIMIVLLAILIMKPAEAKSKRQISASGQCLTLKQARAHWRKDKLSYRIIRGRRCWFAHGKALPHKRRVAATHPVATKPPLPMPVKPMPPARPRPEIIPTLPTPPRIADAFTTLSDGAVALQRRFADAFGTWSRNSAGLVPPVFAAGSKP